MPASVWLTARQRDFTGGENLSLLPEKVGRNQFVCMENAIISPQGEVTAPWQMDKPLFTNATSGVVLVPISGSRLYTVYAVATGGVIQFTVDPQSSTPYDLANASGYPGYAFHAHVSPVSILGISHGTPFLGKYYCCASTNLYITGGELTASAVVFPAMQNTLVATLNMTVTNHTGSDVTLTGASFTGDSSMFTQSGVFPQSVAAGASYTFPITYSPTSVGSHAATLDVRANIGILQAPVSGESENLLTLSSSFSGYVPATSITLPPVHVGTYSAKALKLSYTGTGSVTISSAAFSGPDAAICSTYFYKNSATVSLPFTIAAGDYVELDIYMQPNSVGAKYSTCSLHTSVLDFTVAVTGSGT